MANKINVIDMEPSEEFPILFGLLTECTRKGHHASSTPFLKQNRQRSNGTIPSFLQGLSSSRRGSSTLSTFISKDSVCIAEPDSSTPDHTGEDIHQNLNSNNQKSRLDENPTREVDASSSNGSTNDSRSSSPLLILRLTSNSSGLHPSISPIKGISQNGPTSIHDNQHLNQRYTHRTQKLIPIHHHPHSKRGRKGGSSWSIVKKEDDCLPTSTTPDEDEILKRARFSSIVDSPKRDVIIPELSNLQPCISVSQLSGSTSSSSIKGYSSEESSISNTIRNRTSVNSSPEQLSSVANISETLPKSNTTSSSVFFDRGEDHPYTCSHCDLKFNRQLHLLRHVAIHEDKRDFRCSHCNTAFCRKDNLLFHQSNCHRSSYLTSNISKHQKRSFYTNTGSSIGELNRCRPNRPPRPPPKTLADLLDRKDDDYYESLNESIGNYIQLPSGLEICEVGYHSNQQLKQSSQIEKENEASNQVDDTEKHSSSSSITNSSVLGSVDLSSFEQLEEKTSTISHQSRKRQVIERINLVDGCNNEIINKETVEIYPCGECSRIFRSFSRLLKHSASKHIKNPTNGTFHFEIETIVDESNGN